MGWAREKGAAGAGGWPGRPWPWPEGLARLPAAPPPHWLPPGARVAWPDGGQRRPALWLGVEAPRARWRAVGTVGFPSCSSSAGKGERAGSLLRCPGAQRWRPTLRSLRPSFLFLWGRRLVRQSCQASLPGKLEEELGGRATGVLLPVGTPAGGQARFLSRLRLPAVPLPGLVPGQAAPPVSPGPAEHPARRHPARTRLPRGGDGRQGLRGRVSMRQGQS